MDQSVAPLLHWMLPESIPFSQPVGLLWTYLIDNFSRFQLATLGVTFMHQIALIIGCLPGFIAQFIRAADKYKIQDVPGSSMASQAKCILFMIFAHYCIQLPLLAAAYRFTPIFNVPLQWHLVPPWYMILPKLFLGLAFEDMWHYFSHRLLHVKVMFKYIHKYHHQYQSPFAACGEVAHPLEQGLIGLGTIFGVILFCDHLFLMYLLSIIRLLELCQSHSGYNIISPMSILHLFPFYAGPTFHDFHHSNCNGNYASIFIWWDWIFGTDVQYKQHNLKLMTRRNKYKGKKR